MKRLLCFLALVLVGCNTPYNLSLIPRSQPTVAPTVDLTPTPFRSSAPLGTAENPLVLALPPSTQPKADVLQAGRVLVSLLEKATGFKVVSVIPPNETQLVQAFGGGNAHIASLSPFGYLMASQQDQAKAAFGREQGGNLFYGAQFLARLDSRFFTYYDPVQAKNLAEADVALGQLANKKPCWTDTVSPSGYVVPLGLLAEAGVPTREAAFLAGHPAVVRALYAGGICDFGATYVDARLYPGLEDELADVAKKVVVIWRIPPIIPYETLVYAHSMPADVGRALTRAFVDLMGTAEGKAAMQTLYGFEAMQVTQDSQYTEFRAAVKASGLDLSMLVK
jgi:phosphate/phosphite/phosphonate ABC transporter binding protein